MSRIAELLLLSLSHNDNHFMRVHIDGKNYPLCTRCTGMLVGVALSIPFALLLGVYEAPGMTVAGISLALLLPDLVYWSLTRLRLIHDRNFIRAMNGFLLGVGMVGYGQARIDWPIKFAIPLLIIIAWNLVNLFSVRRAIQAANSINHPSVRTSSIHAILKPRRH